MPKLVFKIPAFELQARQEITIMCPIPLTYLLLAWMSLTIHSSSANAQNATARNTKYPQHVLIIRHAEKTGKATDIHLSEKGKERAAALHEIFAASSMRPDALPTPDYIFAARDSKDSRRPSETVQPLAMKLKLPVNQRFSSKVPADSNGMRELRDEIFGDEKYFGKTVLIVWRHSTIPQLANMLKARVVPPKWKDEEFDRVWHISYDDNGKATFRDRPQRLLPGDATK